ncbi:MAG: hypothetical protein AAF354_14825 [Pseudomonadota bacterium]
MSSLAGGVIAGISGLAASFIQGDAAESAADTQANAAAQAATIQVDAAREAGQNAMQAASVYGDTILPAAIDYGNEIRNTGRAYSDVVGNNVNALRGELGAAAETQVNGVYDASRTAQDAAHAAHAARAGGYDAAERNYLTESHNAYNRFNPMVESGDAARAAYMYNLGLGEAPEGYTGYSKTPEHAAHYNDTMRAVESGFAGQGAFNSGAMLKAKQENASKLHGYHFGTHQNNLNALAGQGSAARGSQANILLDRGAYRSNIAQNWGASEAAAIQQAAAARGAAQEGAAGIRANALNSGANAAFTTQNALAVQRLGDDQRAAGLYFDGRMGGAQAGLQASGVQGQQIAAAGNAAAQGIYGAGNAAAAGQIGQGNAYADGIGSTAAIINALSPYLSGKTGSTGFKGIYG